MNKMTLDRLCLIELLGGLRVVQQDRVISRFSTQKSAALLAYLAYYRQRSHPRDELIELLWPDRDLEAGRMSLRTALASLRRQLESPGIPAHRILVANRSVVYLNPDAVTTYVVGFEAALQSAEKAAEPAARIRSLAEAAQWYKGPLLPGFYEDWITVEKHGSCL